MQDKKILYAFFLIAPFMIGCRSIYMSAEERNQGAIIAEDSVTLNEASEMDKMLWEEVRVKEYEMDKIASTFLEITKDQIDTLSVTDEHGYCFLEYGSDDNPNEKATVSVTGQYFRIQYPYSECYESAMNKASDLTNGKWSFGTLYSYYDKDQLDGLSLEEARKICEDAISTAELPFSYVEAIALDCDHLNQNIIQRIKYDEEYGASELFPNPYGGPSYVLGETEEIIDSWNKEDEAYILFYQQNYNDDFISPLSLGEYLTIVCRTDGKIVSVLASPMLEMPEEEGTVENTISAQEAYSYAKVMLQQNDMPEAIICSVTMNHVARYKSDENMREVFPCWTVEYKEKEGRVSSYLHLDAVTGMEATNVSIY